MLRVPPDLLGVEFGASAEIDLRVLFAHAEFFVVRERLPRRAVILDIIAAPLKDYEILVLLFGRTPVPVVLVARVGRG